MPMIEHVFTAASADQANFVKLSIPDREAQALRVFAWSDASSGSATLRVVMRETVTNILSWADDAPVTVGTIRRNAAGTGGEYLCGVAFASTSSDKLDLMPRPKASEETHNTMLELAIGCTALATIASLRVFVGWDDEI